MMPVTINDGNRAEACDGNPDADIHDCVTRALSIYLNTSYAAIMDRSVELLRESDYYDKFSQDPDYFYPYTAGYPHELIVKLYKEYGLTRIWQATQVDYCGLKVYLDQPVSCAHKTFGDCIVHLHRHVVCLRAGHAHDTYDSVRDEYGDEAMCDIVWVVDPNAVPRYW